MVSIPYPWGHKNLKKLDLPVIKIFYTSEMFYLQTITYCKD